MRKRRALALLLAISIGSCKGHYYERWGCLNTDTSKDTTLERGHFEHERRSIRNAGRDSNLGLALSGGGIRSAAYAMGILRGLHEAKIDCANAESILSRVGYLSTVSGGGFTGGWYVYHDNSDEDLLGRQSEHRRHVIGNGHYLTSGHYSRSTSELLVKIAVGLSFWPFSVLFDEVFHWQWNVYGLRDAYRRGLRSTFLYDVTDGFPVDRLWPYPMPIDRACLIRKEDTVASLCPSESHEKPYWIVNMHLVLRDEESPPYRNRTGDGFELTPHWAGARSVGYAKVDGHHDSFWMQPHYAIAISGAALDSDSLVLGSVANAITYMSNANLGYYVRSWNDINPFRNLWWLLSSPLPINRILGYLLPTSLMVDHRFTRSSKFFGLTDGGHFENTGAYALIKRQVPCILIADASFDPLATQWNELPAVQRADAFADIRKLERLVRADFGYSLTFEWEKFEVGGVANLLVGEVKGADGPMNVIVLKAAYQIPDKPDPRFSELDAEKARNPDFPDDPLLRQLFSEQRFMAYEMLGYFSVTENLDELRRVLEAAGCR